MSYRFNTPSYERARPRRRIPSTVNWMLALLGAFVVLSLLVLLAGRLPFPPTPAAIEGNTYRSYVDPARTLLGTYGYTMEGRVHIPIDRAMDLLVERGLPVRDEPSATP